MPSMASSIAYASVPGISPVRELSRGATIEEGTPRQMEEDNARRARVTVAKVFLDTRTENQIEIETGSVYGSAFVIPQIARSAMWSPKLVVLCIRSYFFLAFNCFLQWMLVYELMKEAQVMNKFSGKMWICDFGAEKAGCPEGPGCIGPGGTRITPSRMYSYDQWNLQNFAKYALLEIFPERQDFINDNIDPGEYGLESMHCRILCTLLFVFAVSQEFTGSMRMLRLLYSLPCSDDSWVDENPDGEVRLLIRGMPRVWKLINFIFVMVPRFMLWQFTCRTGMLFLIETAGMENTIVNATALCFILDIDELIFEVFSTDLTKHMLQILEGFKIPKKNSSISSRLAREDADVIEESDMNRYCSSAIIPWMIIQALAIWIYFHWVYYSSHCFKSADGTYVSIPMYLPKSTHFSHLTAFLPQTFPIEEADKPYWTWANEAPKEAGN